MAKCSFCGYQLAPGSGKKYVENSGKAYHFCSGKCEKNMMVLKRKSRKIKWTKEYKKGE
ncbi:50S ribosomal protein L24e [Candidatus Woesearchaeota archaeon]|nr:50S ribosomal protein L24e [Candidatus Woesearchaeota archaeon]